jgi:CAAX prenyl protease-like protein
MFDRDAWPRILPFALYMLFVFVADMAARAGLDEASLRYLYPLKIGAVLAALLLLRRHYTELGGAIGLRETALAVAAGVLVLVLWLHLDAGWMTLGQSSGYDPRGAGGAVSWPLAIVRLLGAALVVPVMEELFWRSFLLRWIDAPDFMNTVHTKIKYRGFVVSVILFGIEHNLWFAGVVAGVVYSLLYMRRGNLWSAIVAHAVTNGLLGVFIIYTEQWTYW